jgi:Ni,Fe-hydrogenase III large subunit
MVPWVEFRNLQVVPVSSIVRLPPSEFRDRVMDGAASGWRAVQFFGHRQTEGTVLTSVMADDDRSRLYALAALFENETSYPSLTPDIPAFHLFEREFYEEFAIEPMGHPWLKPVRRGIAGVPGAGTPTAFFHLDGDEVHEVGVGPIHAGVIEPGHFRFSCQGEDVHHLEIELGFQHRGVEGLFLKHGGHPTYPLHLAESIAGDSVIGHAGAFAAAMESLGRTSVSRRAMAVRVIALELERLAAHLGDLSALAGDVAFATGNAAFGALRTKTINTTLALCGSRFGRGLMAVGGVHFDIPAAAKEAIRAAVDDIETGAGLAAEVLFGSASVLARFEKTGIVYEETARRLGLVGPAARACGLSRDVRSDHPAGGYAYIPIHKMTLDSGDVFARAYIRYVEIGQSARIIREQLTALGEGDLRQPCSAPAPGTLVVSLVEGWRGEIAHVVITGADGRLERYKIKDPSFANWFGLALAVRGNEISDFPVCNKSFNLSYCGFDL